VLQIDLLECYRVWCLLSDFTRSAANKAIDRFTKFVGWAVQGAKLLSDNEGDNAYSRAVGCPFLLVTVNFLLDETREECAAHRSL
jgi:hypothetical protein